MSFRRKAVALGFVLWAALVVTLTGLIQYSRTSLLRNHAAMQSVGDEMGVSVWDLHDYLASDAVYDSGILWWDEVHLTSYGHRLAGEWLAERMMPLVEELGDA